MTKLQLSSILATFGTLQLKAFWFLDHIVRSLGFGNVMEDLVRHA